MEKQQGESSVASCIAPYRDEDRPKTPENLNFFRESYKNQPGKSFIHRGAASIKLDDDVRYGMTSGRTQDDSVAELVHQKKTYFEEQSESIYHSSKSAPLGHTPNHFPENSKPADFPFGVRTVASESAKGVIFPKESEKEASEDQLPVAGVKANYDWKGIGIDPGTYTFGQSKSTVDRLKGTVNRDDQGIKAVFSNALPTASNDLNSEIIPSRAARRQEPGIISQAAQDLLNQLPSGYTFGSKPAESNEWNAKRCIHEQHTDQEILPDKDLGISKMSLARGKYVPENKAGAVFGVGTIRSDKVAPRMRSVADTTNYGDEKGAKSLVNPASYNFEGVSEDDFTRSRTEHEVRTLFEAIEGPMKDAEFNSYAAAALKSNNILSITSFRAALNSSKYGIK